MTKAEKYMADAPCHYNAGEASAWANGYNACLATQADAPADVPQSPPDAWRWRYEGCKGWMYTDNEPAFFPDEEKLKPEVQRLCASAHSRPDRKCK